MLENYRFDEERDPDPADWLVGYYDKPRSWEGKGPKAGKISEIHRRKTSQAAFAPAGPLELKRPFPEKLSRKAQQLDAQAAKRRRLHARTIGGGGPESEDEASSDSSSSDSSSSEPDAP